MTRKGEQFCAGLLTFHEELQEPAENSLICSAGMTEVSNSDHLRFRFWATMALETSSSSLSFRSS